VQPWGPAPIGARRAAGAQQAPSRACADCHAGAPAHRYGGPHRAPELQKEAVYGITELHREAVRGARLVANPGCYPTSVQLPLVPLLQARPVSCPLNCAHPASGALLSELCWPGGARRVC